MSESLIRLGEPQFWLVLVLGAVILAPISHPRVREWAWAAINAGFLFLLPSRVQFVAVIATLAVVWFLLRGAASRSRGLLTTLLLAVALLGLFAVHKFPALTANKPTPLALTLAAIGFSYVSLRAVDALRAIYSGRQAPPSLPGTVNYLVPFHMLAAGPIQSYDEFVQQPAVPERPNTEQMVRACERIARGLIKKFVLAYFLQRAFLTGFEIPGWYFAFEAQVFYVWLYLDFSAISDIAVGVGGILGIATPENFDRPFTARNIITFWERWHISLSQFIRRNLYIPIQLAFMRQTQARHALWCSSAAFLVAFGFCGLWHAGTLRFFLWGLLHGTALIVTNLYRHVLTTRLGTKGVRAYMANPQIRWVSTAITFEFVAFSLVVFQI